MGATKVIFIFVGVIFLACAAVAALGFLVQRLIRKRSPDSQVLARFTATGVALTACFTVAMVVGAAAWKLAPDSVLGAFLNAEYGVVKGLGLGWLAFSVASTVLHLLGHPIAEIRKRR